MKKFLTILTLMVSTIISCGYKKENVIYSPPPKQIIYNPAPKQIYKYSKKVCVNGTTIILKYNIDTLTGLPAFGASITEIDK